MKNNILFVLFFLLTFCYQPYSYASDHDPLSVWPRSEFPIRFVMDSENVPVGVINSSIMRNEMIRSVDKWNQSRSLGSMFYIIKGAVDNSSTSNGVKNGSNEIKFISWDPSWPLTDDAVTQSLSFTNPDLCIETPKEGCLRQRHESDIYFNPYLLITGVPSGFPLVFLGLSTSQYFEIFS